MNPVLRTFVVFAILAGAVLAGPITAAHADPYRVVVQGRELIVHKNAVPVVVHRVLPPYWNKHVTERELKSGRLPRSSAR